MQGISLVARGVVGLVGAVVLWTPGVASAGPEDGPPIRRDTTCATVLEGDRGWELQQETDPADGSHVHPGDDVAVLMTWDETDFADGPLYNTLDCVTVDGALDESLSLVEADPPNDGEFTHNFTVPDVAAGTEICSRGAVVGDGDGYFELNPSNDVCFTVIEAPAPPEACVPGSSEGTPPGSSDACAPPEVCVPGSLEGTPPGSSDACAPGSETPPSSPAKEPSLVPGTPPVVAGATEERPAPAVEPTAEVAPVQGVTLPATGNPARTIAVLAGILLALGGGVIIGAVKRPASFRAGARRRRA